MTQEKLTLEQRIVAEYNKTDLSARLVGAFALKMVRMELEKAAEIAEQAGIFSVSREIRKLME